MQQVGRPSGGAAPERRRLFHQLPAITPRRFRQLAVASLVMTGLIVVTGAAVRLTGSGLGCPDWPTCYHTQVTPQLSFHPLIEFSNRMVTVVLTVVIAVTVVASWLRTPRRPELCWLSLGLVGGVVAQAVLGAIVVYTKLNPYVVMVHFLASMVLIGVAVVLVQRSSWPEGEVASSSVVPRPLLLLSRGMVVLLGLVLAAGTATTGAGPHAGNATGQQVARRIPVALRDMAELHSSLALLLIGVTLALAVALHAVDTPERVRRRGRVLVMVMVAQAAVGYTQYFTHLPVALVEVHVIGATSLVIGAVLFHLSLSRQRSLQLPGVPGLGSTRTDGAGTPGNGPVPARQLQQAGTAGSGT